jgi:DNA repair exonuclease SbcCD ATPase subunit
MSEIDHDTDEGVVNYFMTVVLEEDEAGRPPLFDTLPMICVVRHIKDLRAQLAEANAKLEDAILTRDQRWEMAKEAKKKLAEREAEVERLRETIEKILPFLRDMTGMYGKAEHVTASEDLRKALEEGK